MADILALVDKAIDAATVDATGPYSGYPEHFAKYAEDARATKAALVQEIQGLLDENAKLRACALSEDDIWLLAAAVENLRSSDRTEARAEAAFRIASKLETLRLRHTKPFPHK